MERIGDDLLLDQLRQCEDYLQGAADAIDVKASQTIAAAAFLAVQPAVLLIADNVSRVAVTVQILSYVSIGIAIYQSHCALDVRNYPSPGFPKDWYATVQASIPSTREEDVLASMKLALITAAEGRIAEARVINEQRLVGLQRARNAVIWGICLNAIAFLIAIASKVIWTK